MNAALQVLIAVVGPSRELPDLRTTCRGTIHRARLPIWPQRHIFRAGAPPSPFEGGSLSPTRKHHIQCWLSIWYILDMATARKITVEIPEDLLQKAQQASGTGVTQTVRTGLELLAASNAYARLRQFRGKVRFSRTLAQLKDDR